MKLPIADLRISSMTDEQLEQVREAEAEIKKHPQLEIGTHHLIHAGIYARTVLLPAGVMISGAETKIATTLIISGRCQMSVGGETKELHGYNILAASKKRKQLFVALEDTMITMLFPSSAKSVEEAEREFTDDADKLMSRSCKNTIVITGE